MKNLCLFFLLLLSPLLQAQDTPVTGDALIARNDVTWTTLGKNENDSMPIGNGDLAANVWTEQNGDLVLLLAKSDAWTQLGQLVKPGRIRIKLTPNPFAGATDFTQTLKLETGEIEIKSGTNTLLVWVDANRPVMHVEAHLDQPATLQANLELWRTKTRPYHGEFFDFGDHALPVNFEPDTVLPAGPNAVTWCHFNPSSVYPIVLQQEHLASLLDKYPDPLLHRCFGATMSGPGLVAADDHTLKSSFPSRDLRLDIVPLTQTAASSPQTWQASLLSLAATMNRIPLDQARAAHEQWWKDFWNRSWISVSGDPIALKVSQGYAMQRWMLACSSRGALPVKFNGGLFTVGHDMPDGTPDSNENHSPDYRLWGGCYWNQNNRLLYWPLITTGDEDLLKPWYDMYLNALPLAKDRTRIYYHHDGAAFIETMHFWGLPNLHDFGWDHADNVVQSGYMRYHIQGALEVTMQMLDTFDAIEDPGFARKYLVPFADAIVTYYDQHWPRGADGKIDITPSQSLETYQIDAENPTPDVAGLYAVLPRLLALPATLTTDTQRAAWKKMLQDLPPIPMGKTAGGKLPPKGVGDPNGIPTILPAEKYDSPSNSENPELYVAFPYRLYGVGKPDLKLVRDTYAARINHADTCWGQDGTESAAMGITADAQKAVIDEFTHSHGNQRYSWFWIAENDWIPDLDNGGSGMITLQSMLMQCDGKRILLLPAWPAGWTADFKLHAPYRTTVQGHVANGKITDLKVTPASRAADVVVCPVP